MDFDLSDDHEAFRDLMREFVAREITPVARDLEHSGHEPLAIIDQMKTMGLFGLNVDVEYGGLGADSLTLAIVFEELSKVGWVSPAPSAVMGWRVA